MPFDEQLGVNRERPVFANAHQVDERRRLLRPSVEPFVNDRSRGARLRQCRELLGACAVRVNPFALDIRNDAPRRKYESPYTGLTTLVTLLSWAGDPSGKN